MSLRICVCVCVCVCRVSLWGVSRGWLKGNESFSSLMQTHKHLSARQRTINQNASSHDVSFCITFSFGRTLCLLVCLVLLLHLSCSSKYLFKYSLRSVLIKYILFPLMCQSCVMCVVCFPPSCVHIWLVSCPCLV